MKKIITPFIISVLLAGSSYAADSTLAEKLKSQNAEEQKETFRLACLNRAEKITGLSSMWKKSGHSSVPIRNAKIEQMKKTCREMTVAYAVPTSSVEYLQPAAGGSLKTKTNLQLSQECNAQLQNLDSAKNGNAIRNMKEVCDIILPIK